MQRLFSTTALAAALLGLAAPVARAQDDHETRMMDISTESYNANISTITNGQLNKKMLDDASRRHGGAGVGTTAAERSRSVAKVRTTDFVYMTSAAARQEAVDRYLAAYKPRDPAAAAKLETALRPGGKAATRYAYPKINRAANLRDYDAADILASYLLLNYRIVNNVVAEPTEAQARGVRVQAARTLSKKPQSDDALAALGEDLKLRAVILDLAWQGNRQKGTTAAFSQQVASTFQSEYKFDMRQRQLSAAGLTPK